MERKVGLLVFRRGTAYVLNAQQHNWSTADACSVKQHCILCPCRRHWQQGCNS